MRKKYRVTLTEAEQEFLHQQIQAGKCRASRLRRTQILLTSDESPGGKALTDSEISAAYNCASRTVENIRRRFVEDGLDLALNGKPRPASRKSKIDGRVLSQLSALLRSDPPVGHNRWSFLLLGDKLVELQLVESISRQGIANALKNSPQTLAR